MPEMRSGNRSAVAVVCLAIILRLLAVWGFLTHQPVDVFFKQATELGSLAASVATGHGLSSPFGRETGASAFLSPGYPLLVGGIFRTFGLYSTCSAIVLLVMQAIFGTTTVAVLMIVTRRMVGNASAKLAGLACALSPPLILLTTLFWETSLTILLFVSLVAAAHGCRSVLRTRRWFGLGLLSALSLMVNPALLPVVACSIIWAAWPCMPARRLRLAGLTFLTCAALCFPWVIRNAEALHTFIPFRTNLGYELWQGNRTGADGYFDQTLHPNVNAVEFRQYRALGEVSYMREKMELGKAAIRQDPMRFARLTCRRVMEFWTGAGRVPAGPLVAYVIISDLFALAGMLLLWTRCRECARLLAALLLLFPMPYYLTHPDARFRLVFEPIMLMLAAHAVNCLYSKLRQATVQSTDTTALA